MTYLDQVLFVSGVAVLSGTLSPSPVLRIIGFVFLGVLLVAVIAGKYQEDTQP